MFRGLLQLFHQLRDGPRRKAKRDMKMNRYILCYKKGKSMSVCSDEYKLHAVGSETADGKIVLEESSDLSLLQAKADAHNAMAPRIVMGGMLAGLFTCESLA